MQTVLFKQVRDNCSNCMKIVALCKNSRCVCVCVCVCVVIVHACSIWLVFVKRYSAVVFAGSVCSRSGVRIQCGQLSLLQSQQPALSHLLRSWPGESDHGMWHFPLHTAQPHHLTCALEGLSHNHTRPEHAMSSHWRISGYFPEAYVSYTFLAYRIHVKET